MAAQAGTITISPTSDCWGAQGTPVWPCSQERLAEEKGRHCGVHKKEKKMSFKGKRTN